jgi:hypothetical protein
MLPRIGIERARAPIAIDAPTCQGATHGLGAGAGLLSVLSATLLYDRPALGALAIAAVLGAYAMLGAVIQPQDPSDRRDTWRFVQPTAAAPTKATQFGRVSATRSRLHTGPRLPDRRPEGDAGS